MTKGFARHAVMLAVPLALAGSGTAAAPGYGTVRFANSCAPASQAGLQLQIAKLHSFESEAADFAAIGKRDKSCAIAWWGAAMSARGNPIGDSLDAKTLQAGRAFIDRALAVKTVSPREKALIDAMDVYYRPYADQTTRARAYADRMDRVRAAYPDDPDIAALDGLAIIEGVDLDDRTFARQRRAGAILHDVMRAHPEHPGVPHYLIHADDFTTLAQDAVQAAQVYPTIATASSHANHMPAHIWSMLGDWDKVIAANRRSSYLADPASGNDRIKGDIVFAHALDFIAYARLQKAEDKHVAADIAALDAPPLIVRARYALERDDWAAATRLPVPEDPFDAVLARFARGYGAARMNDAAEAKQELAALGALKASVQQSLGSYWATYVDIYGSAIAAWILKIEGNPDEAVKMMTRAADRDAAHEKHIYLENKLLPMREALGDLQLSIGHPSDALEAYQASLDVAPNRYRSYLGAARAAASAGNRDAARHWFDKLIELTKDGDYDRSGEHEARAFLGAPG